MNCLIRYNLQFLSGEKDDWCCPPVLRMDDAQPHQAILSHPHKAPPCHLLHTKAFLGVSPSKQYQVTPSPAQFYYTRPVPETPHSTGGKNLHSASSTTSVENLIISNFLSWRSFHLVQPAHQQHSTEPQTLAFGYFPLYQPGNHIFNNCFSTSWIQLTAEAGVLTSDDNSLTVIFTCHYKLISERKFNWMISLLMTFVGMISVYMNDLSVRWLETFLTDHFAPL